MIQYIFATFLSLASISVCVAGCTKGNKTLMQSENNNGNTNQPTGNNMKITVGTAVFTATLNNNATATAFKAMLPFTINMSELNGNEKYFYFSTTLPVNAASVGNIQAGDLMLYGNNCLVLFYEGFNTSYRYTRLGKIDNATGLAAALGEGSVTVKFALE